MKPPTTVQVGATNYKVRFSSEITDALDCVGACAVDTQLLVLKPGLATDQERDTLLHEVLHACSYQMGLKNRHSSDVEEDFVNCLSTALFDLIRRNPRLVAYLSEKP